MAGQEDPVQREIHQDWANREYIEVITSSIKKIADFLNSFGQRARRGRRDRGRRWGSWAGARRRFGRAPGERSAPAALASSFGPHLPPPCLALRLPWVAPVGLPCSRLRSAASLPLPRIPEQNKSFVFPDSSGSCVHLVGLCFSSVVSLRLVCHALLPVPTLPSESLPERVRGPVACPV